MADETIKGPDINETCEQISGKMNEDTCEISMADNAIGIAKMCDGISLEEVSADLKQDASKRTTESDFIEKASNCKLKYDSELNMDNRAFVQDDDVETAAQTPDSNDTAVLNTNISQRSSNGSDESTSIDTKSITSSSTGKSSNTILGHLNYTEEGPPGYASKDSELGRPEEASGDDHQESMFLLFINSTVITK